MSLRARLVGTSALLALVTAPAAAADLQARRGRIPPASPGPARVAPADLASIVAQLEQRDRAQQAEFAAAAARALPPKARQRLEETRRAWADGQGRILQALRARRDSDRAGAPAAAASSPDVDEALELLRRIRAASRMEPLSQAELKTRVPSARPPALAVGPSTQAVAGDAAPIGEIPPEVRQAAASLAGPIEAYEWVRNGIRPELYHGFMKGPVQTLREASGNDADTASLLVALLRAKGIPARYVRGTVELPAALAVAVTGTSDPNRALRAFQRAGVPSEPVDGPGGIVALRVERIWAEAYVPYANYRGALLDAFEKAWVPLDPGLKRLAPPGGFAIRSVGFDPVQAFDDYLAAAPGPTPLEFLRQRATDALAAKRPDVSYEQALARRDVIAQSLGHLPSTLPFAVVTRADVSYVPPDPLVHMARFLLQQTDATLLDASFPVPTLLGQRLTLSYVPSEADDEEVVRQYGGLFQTPPYLVEVKPVLKLGGVVIASGAGGAGLGTKLDFRIELATPAGEDQVLNRIVAGNLTAIGLAAGGVPADEDPQDEAARILAGLAFHYLDRWNHADDELAALLRVVPVRPSVSTCLVESAVQVEYAGGDALYPVRYDWKGLAIDADRRPSAPVGIESDAAERDFLLASGLQGSVLEHRLFEDDLGIASVSTAKALQLVAQSGAETLDVGPENADALLPGLPFDDAVKGEIRDAAAKGYRIRVPDVPLTVQAWTGTGYLILDADTGESAWQLQGGYSGGVTAPAVIDLPSKIVDAVWRQSETPSPTPGGVVFLQKFDSTDYQTGTVDKPLPKALKVLVTDEDGFPVPGAPVTFSVIGGGGLLVDPATARAGASEVTVLSCVGGEKKEPCASLEPGEAVAVLRLGRRTDEIPRYTCEEPFTCTCPTGTECDPDQVGYSTQVGINLVTVRSGDVALAVPFTAVGFPELAPVEGQPGVYQVYMDLAAPPIYNPVNLTVADRMALSVTDRLGNPISNVRVKVSFEGPPELGPPPTGGSLYRPATNTPGHVLRAQDYEQCIRDTPSVIWGQCPGEAEAVWTRSSARGVFTYPILGDSPWSYYKFDYGTDLTPAVGWVKYHTDGLSCLAPQPFACGDWQSPITLVWQGQRDQIANVQGNAIEAYRPGSTAEVGLWADVVWEEARVARAVDDQGQEHFSATGTNVWHRDRLTDSQFSLQASSPGTGVDAAAPHVGGGRYSAAMTLAPDPRLNAVQVDGKHYPPLVKYAGSAGGDVDPSTVDRPTLTLRRVKDPTRPIQARDTFRLWGALPRITKVEPSPVFLGSGGRVTRPSTVTDDIAPPEYRILLAPNDVHFEVHAAADDHVVLAANGAETPTFTIPAGLSVAGGDYARLSVPGVSGNGVDLASPNFPVPICSLLDLLTPKLEVHVARDPLNERLCGSGDKLRFTLCRASRVTLTVAGAPFTASVDGGAPQSLTDATLGPGLHEVLVPVGVPELEADETARFHVEATDAEEPLQIASADGVIVMKVVNRSVLPVGHTFVKGVDLLDGHVVRQSTDLKVPGRHLGLEVTRTYSSAGWSSEGPLGGGWSLNDSPGLFVDGACGLATVVAGDGSSQVFHSSDGLLTFTPQKGYHTKLEREGSVWRFTDKAGNVHHFESPDAEGRPRLDFVEEPHGDRLVYTYDGTSRLTKVAEVQKEAGEVRAVAFTYRSIYGFDRIVRAEVPSLGLAVDYAYDDARGDLVKVTRDGRNLDGTTPAQPRVESYRYLALPTGAPGQPAADPRKEHQLVAAVDPNGNWVEYAYHQDGDRLPGEDTGAGGLVFEEKWELARQVVEHPAPGINERTELLYDLTHWPVGERWTTVRDGRGNDTLYVLNGNGSPLRIEEPLGKTTQMSWAADDILKTKETDALGRVTDFGYDARGNLTSERITTADLGVVETSYQYDPRFNKLTYKKDAEGRETAYTIDAESGDLLAAVDALGNRTAYAYDEHGRLQTVTDPRRHATTHSDHDSFGNARTITDPLGNVTTREFDLRGRLTRQADTMGHETRQVWDGFDRLVRTTRVAGGDSDDGTTETTYYAGGETHTVKNANGAETVFTLDGLNRVTATETRLDDQVLDSRTTYDANGNKETETDRRGVTKRNTWDALNRLAGVEITSGLPGEGPTGTIAGYTYDLVGNRLSETNVAGLTTRFEYDGLYRVKAKILPEMMPDGLGPAGPLTERYEYDRAGNRTSLTDANGHATTWAYDGLNRLTRTTDALGHVTTAAYDDPEGSHVNKSEDLDTVRGLRTTYLYDKLNRETERRVTLEGEDGDPGAPPVYTTTTAYDDPSHALTVTDPRGTATRVRLDGLDRQVERTVDPSGLGLVTRTSYDGLGNRKSETDANGHTTGYRHDGLGRLVETTDALGQAATFAYDGEGLKARETDRRGIVRTFSHDNLGRPRREALASAPLSGVAWSRQTQYRDRQRQRVETDARGHATTFDLDGLDRVLKETDALGHFRTFLWDGTSKREETDKRSAHHRTRFEYDALDRLTKTTDPAPFDTQTAETTYEDALNRVTEKDRRGFLKRTQHDPLGRVVSVTQALGTPDEAVLETNAYDGNGNKTVATDAEGRQTRFQYDPANRLSAREEGFGTADAAVTTFVHDGVGNVLEERDARAAALGEPWSVKRTYDPLNRQETETNGEGDTTSYGYDPEGNRTSTQTPKGPATAFEYDELGKLLRVTQPPVPVFASGGAGSTVQAPVTSYAYDENRNRIRQTDANGHGVEISYDALNRLDRMTQKAAPEGDLVTAHEYDENGNETLTTDPKGQKVTITYDELNRPSTKSFTPVSGWAPPWRYTTGLVYTHDPNGNLTRIDESVASGTSPPDTTLTTLRTYDGLDRLASETAPLPDGGTRTVTHAYYRNGTRRTVTDPSGVITFYEYDGQNRLAATTTGFGTPAAATTRQTYWPDDLLKTVTYPNGVVATYSYDKADRLLTLDNANGPATISRYEYGYDSNGNRLSQVETNGGPPETTGYTYDDLDRLASVTYPADASYPTGRVVSYGYDAVGNRVRETERAAGDGMVLADRQGIFDNVNRLASLEEVAKPETDPSRLTAFAWDANGNQIRKTVGTGPGATTTTYAYDLRDKLVEAGQAAGEDPTPTSILGRFQYDFDGRRIKKIGEEGLRQYVYDQTSLLTEYDAGGLQKAKYDYGSDRLISLTRADEGRRYFSLDGLRSVVNLTDDLGSAVASYHLDPWGNFRFPDELTHSANRFAFTGHIFDTETGLYNAKARYFDPKLGRFLTQDSFLGQIDEPPSLHRYVYANDNPTAFVDPTGHASVQAGRIEDFAEQDLRTLAGHDPTQPAGQVLESPEDAHAREQARADTARRAKVEKGAADRMARLGELDKAGFSHYANITIEESDFVDGRLDRARVLAAVEQHLGNYAASEAPWLVDALLGRLQGARAGASVDVSEIYSAAYAVSAAKAQQVALQEGAAGSYAYMGAMLGQRGAAPADLVTDAGFGIANAGANDVMLALGGYAAVRGLAGAVAGFSRDVAASAPSSAGKPQWLRDVEAGDAFNRARAFDYSHREVYVRKPGGEGYYRLDAYDPARGEIVSRKLTDFAKISEETGVGYVSELARKYPAGARIADVPSSGPLAGQRLRGQMILEVPPQSGPIPQAVLDAARQRGVVIRDVHGKVY